MSGNIRTGCIIVHVNLCCKLLWVASWSIEGGRSVATGQLIEGSEELEMWWPALNDGHHLLMPRDSKRDQQEHLSWQQETTALCSLRRLYLSSCRCNRVQRLNVHWPLTLKYDDQSGLHHCSTSNHNVLIVRFKYKRRDEFFEIN